MQGVRQPDGCAIHVRQDDILLGREVQRDGTGRDLCRDRDVCNRRFAIAPLSEQLQRRNYDRRAAPGLVSFA
jgi:hypothetical protein